MWSFRKTNGTEVAMNFVAPEGADLLTREVLFPLAEVQKPTYAATLQVTIKQMDTFLQPEQLTGAVTINLTIDAQVTPGAKLHVKLAADGTARTATIGTGFNAAAPDVVVPAAGNVFVSYEYDGTSFVPVFSTAKVEFDIAANAAAIAALALRVVALEGA